MKILSIGGLAPWDPRAGGGQLVAYKLSEALARAGHMVSYLSTSAQGSSLGQTLPGLTHMTRRAGESWPSVFLHLLKADYPMGQDIIHVHTGSGTLAFYLGCVARRYLKRDVRLALTIHSPKVHSFPRSLDEVGWMLGCRAADVILAVSEFSATDIARCYRVSRPKMEVVYNGVDTQVFHPLTTPGHRSRGAFTLVFCGRLNGTRQKGLDILLDAMSLVLQQHDVVLDVIGVGPRMEEYKTYANRLKLDSRVTFLGFIEHGRLPRYYAQADLLVLPSRRESFGLVLAEAMACGLPVVATAVGAIPEVVQDGVTGILVPPDHPEALAHAINYLLDDPEKMITMGTLGRERVSTHFTWDRVAERVTEAYQRAM